MSARLLRVLLPTAALLWGAGCRPKAKRGAASSPSDPAAALLADAGLSVFDQSSAAYSAPFPSLSAKELSRHNRGDTLFDAKFVSPPAPAYQGLGPLYNNNACAGCHLKDGRGEPKLDAAGVSQLLVFVSMPDGEPAEPGGPVPVPGIGLQLRDHAVAGAQPEATLTLTWSEEAHTYGDGTAYSLRRPHLEVKLKDGSPLPEGTLISLRQPPAVYGLGLLEAVSDETIVALETVPGKVAGHANRVWSQTQNAVVVGRFGWKAVKATLRDQTAKAFAIDMGLTNEPFPADDGGAAEISQDQLDLVEFYLRTLAVPARRDVDDPEVRRGEELFMTIGCSGCHMPTLVTGDHPVAALAHQTIHPYTDLLLHDMGDGLADNRPEFTATGSEWRTRALWGIGLTQTVHPGATYLHDGRARTLEEAILWHGGQAAAYREAFRHLPAADRAALVRFLKSL